jgi:hypothetical protein
MKSKRSSVANKRLANKTIWALEDIVALCIEAQEDWKSAIEQAEKRMDPTMLLSLAMLRDRIAQIQEIARLARQGQYDGGGNGELAKGAK